MATIQLWQLEDIIASGVYLKPDYECPTCKNCAFPCGCFKTPAMEKAVDIAIDDYRAKRFDPRKYYVEGKLTIWNDGDGNKSLALWGRDPEDQRAIRRILPKTEQTLFQALLAQRLNARNLTLQ